MSDDCFLEPQRCFMRRSAVFSLTNKEGSEEFAKVVKQVGYHLLSTGKTGNRIRDVGLEVQEISDYTGVPELFGGRLKTVNHKIFGGIIAKPKPEDEAVLEEMQWDRIDVVCVNLYDFAGEIAKPDVTLESAIEQMDVGGPTMLAAAAKNFRRVYAVCDPADYYRVGHALQVARGDVNRYAGLRLELAQKALNLLESYYHTIAPWVAAQKL